MPTHPGYKAVGQMQPPHKEPYPPHASSLHTLGRTRGDQDQGQGVDSSQIMVLWDI